MPFRGTVLCLVKASIQEDLRDACNQSLAADGVNEVQMPPGNATVTTSRHPETFEFLKYLT